MALVQLGPHKVDIASPADLAQILIAQARDKEKIRGIKDLRKAITTGTPSGTYNTISDGVQVDAGYKWVIQLISVTLASAGTGQVYVTSDPATTLGGPTKAAMVASLLTSGTAQVAVFGKGPVILSESEGLFLNFTQNVSSYLIAGWHVPAERVGELA
jgi:hypothetical protein